MCRAKVSEARNRLVQPIHGPRAERARRRRRGERFAKRSRGGQGPPVTQTHDALRRLARASEPRGAKAPRDPIPRRASSFLISSGTNAAGARTVDSGPSGPILQLPHRKMRLSGARNAQDVLGSVLGRFGQSRSPYFARRAEEAAGSTAEPPRPSWTCVKRRNSGLGTCRGLSISPAATWSPNPKRSCRTGRRRSSSIAPAARAARSRRRLSLSSATRTS